MTNQILCFISEQPDWSMKQEGRNFLRNLSNCWGIVQRNSSKLGNELINIFRNASIGTTVNTMLFPQTFLRNPSKLRMYLMQNSYCDHRNFDSVNQPQMPKIWYLPNHVPYSGLQLQDWRNQDQRTSDKSRNGTR